MGRKRGQSKQLSAKKPMLQKESSNSYDDSRVPRIHKKPTMPQEHYHSPPMHTSSQTTRANDWLWDPEHKDYYRAEYDPETEAWVRSWAKFPSSYPSAPPQASQETLVGSGSDSEEQFIPRAKKSGTRQQNSRRRSQTPVPRRQEVSHRRGRDTSSNHNRTKDQAPRGRARLEADDAAYYSSDDRNSGGRTSSDESRHEWPIGRHSPQERRSRIRRGKGPEPFHNRSSRGFSTPHYDSPSSSCPSPSHDITYSKTKTSDQNTISSHRESPSHNTSASYSTVPLNNIIFCQNAIFNQNTLSSHNTKPAYSRTPVHNPSATHKSSSTYTSSLTYDSPLIYDSPPSCYIPLSYRSPTSQTSRTSTRLEPTSHTNNPRPYYHPSTSPGDRVSESRKIHRVKVSIPSTADLLPGRSPRKSRVTVYSRR